MGLFKKPKVTVQIDFNEEAEAETLQELFDNEEVNGEVKKVEDEEEKELTDAEENKEDLEDEASE
ncbi:hypothetical protein ABTE85_22205, partial [Acinetobacter baumannii]